MDTKSRNIKSNPIFRLFTILITILLCCVFTSNAFTIAKSTNAFGEEAFKKDQTIYDTRSFQTVFYDELNYLLTCANADSIKKGFDTEKKKAVDAILSEFKTQQKYYYENEDDIRECLIDNWGAQTESGIYGSMLEENHHICFSENDEEIYFSSNYYNSLKEYSEYNFYCDSYDDASVYVEIPINSTENRAIQIIESGFLETPWNKFEPIANGDYDKPLESKTLRYYFRTYDGAEISNVGDVAALKSNAGNLDMLTIKNGSANDSRFNKVLDYNDYNVSIGTIKEAYIAFDIKQDHKDEYSNAVTEYNQVMEETGGNIEKQIIACTICLILLVLMLAVHATLAGHKNDGIFTTIIDKLPNDIHLLINGGIIAGMVILTPLLLDSYFYEISAAASQNTGIVHDFITSALFRPVIMAMVCLIWLPLVELVTSYARQIKTDARAFVKNSVLYYICRLAVKAFRFFVIKPAKAIAEMLKYRPESFKKQLVVYIMSYASANVLLILLIVMWMTTDNPDYAFLTAIIYFIFNAVSVGFITDYIIKLDKIIVSIKNDTVADVDYNKLPNSLKQLYDYQKSASEQLSVAVSDAVKNERMRVELITNVSHDLKTPLTSIINYVDLLNKCDIQDETAREYIGVLDEKGAKLKRLIEDLIEASEVTSGVIKLNPIELDLSELATQAVVEHQTEFINNNLELIFKGDKKSYMAFADGQKTFRVIENLLSNARKYSARGTRVYADVYEADEYSVFEIKNTSAQALDITADELKQRFVRGDKSRNQEGNGLGLSIADKLCSAMNGRLEIIIDGDLFKAKVYLPAKSKEQITQ